MAKRVIKRFEIKDLLNANLLTILTLISGILFTAKPDILELICIIIGTLLALGGVGILIYYLVKGRKTHIICVYSIVFMVAGALFGIVPTLLKFLIPIFFGAWLLTSSAAGMYNNFMLRRVNPLWWIGLLLCTAGAAIGVYVITRPVTIIETTIRLIGIAMIIHSALRLASIICSHKFQREAEQTEEPAAKTPEPPAVSGQVIETTIKE